MDWARAGDLGGAEIIRLLGLKPHPEGGHYGETYRAETRQSDRPSSTAIYYLLQADEISAWHRVDADEHWLWHAGATLSLTHSPASGIGAENILLGPNLRAGHRPQATIPRGFWQTAESLGAWSLVSCVVAPGFDFSGFELAPPNWRPEV